jgi:GNAT superfamily N-acetyltransferase
VDAVIVDPYDGVRRLLPRFLGSDAVFCLVAQDGTSELDGFLTGAVFSTGLDDSLDGAIGELFVRPQSRRRGIAGELVEAAVHEFTRRGATLSKVEVPSDWAEGVAFWRTRKQWVPDTLVFSRYQ